MSHAYPVKVSPLPFYAFTIFYPSPMLPVAIVYHRFATSFGTTHGVAYASCKVMPLRHVNTDVFVSTLRVVRALLREHEW